MDHMVQLHFNVLFVKILGESIEDKSNRVKHHRQILETIYNEKYRPNPISATQHSLSDADDDYFLPFFKRARIELPIKNEMEIYFR